MTEGVRGRISAGHAVAAALLAGTVIAAPAAAQPGSGATAELAVTDVNVVDVVRGTILPGRTVIVDDGRIVEIRERRGDADAERVLEGSGRFLIPGLWDAHVHFRGGPELVEANRALLPLFPVNGVTTVRDAGGDLTPAILAWRDRIADGELLGPRILTSGPKLDGPDARWEGSIEIARPSEVPAALDSLEELGADYVKIYDSTISEDVYLAIVEEAAARGMVVTGHMPLAVSFLDAVERGLDATEHLYYAFRGASPVAGEVSEAARAGELGFWSGMYRVLEARDPAAEGATWRAMAREGTAVVPTLHIGEVLGEVERVDHSGDPGLRYVPPAIVETYAGRVRSARRSSPEARERSRALRAAMASVVGPMHDAGVTILAGSDAGPFNSFIYPGFALHAELEALVRAGLTPAEALRSATVEPARFMGRGDELGRVREGYLADLVLLDRNPLEEISNTRSVSAVVLRGRTVLDRAELESLRADLRR